MGDDEIMIMVFIGALGIAGAVANSPSLMPRAFTDGNPGIGLLRLSVSFGMVWTAYVLAFHGDPSIVGIYVVFYLVLAYSATKFFGQALGAWFHGLSVRGDVYERRNTAAAIFVAAYTVAVGFLFGSSLWGEADPLSDDEGGWWIPVGFFALGWITLFVAARLYLWREPGTFLRQLRQERDTGMAVSAAVYLLTCAYLLFDGVAGDFWGWRHGVLGMGTIAMMLIGHEIVLLMGGRGAAPGPVRRLIERVVYVVLALVSSQLQRVIDQAYMAGM